MWTTSSTSSTRRWASRAGAALLALLAVALPGAAQADGREAIISSQDVPVFRAALDAAQRSLSDAVVYDLSRLTREAAEAKLESQKPEVIVAIGPSALRLASQVKHPVPVVYLLVGDPEAIVGPLGERPYVGIELSAAPDETLALLSRLVPACRHLWTVSSSGAGQGEVERLHAAAQTRGMELTVSPAADATAALQDLLKPPPGVQAFVMVPDPRVRNAATDEAVMRLSLDKHIPAVGVSASDVRAGALFAFQLDAPALGAQASELARELAVRGEAGSARPPRARQVVPRGRKLVINLATARRLGITVPPEVLHQAAEVYGP